jgi:hypothetical protein
MPIYVPGKPFSTHVVTYLEKKASQGSTSYKVQSSEASQGSSLGVKVGEEFQNWE